jgi:hypothetical protein
MIKKIAKARRGSFRSKGQKAEKMLINWRHYNSNTSTNTLYDTGMTTAFPYAYGKIPVDFDCHVQSVTMTANKYSSYGTPAGTSASIYLYKGLNTLITSKTLSYTPSQGMQLTFDFGSSAKLSRGEKLSIRWQANGAWRYVNSTIILTER